MSEEAGQGKARLGDYIRVAWRCGEVEHYVPDLSPAQHMPLEAIENGGDTGAAQFSSK